MSDALALCRASIEHHSRSFALATRLMPPRDRDAAHVVYAYCRRADDAVDLAPPGAQRAALDRLFAELEQVYGGPAPRDPVLAAFAELARDRGIPRAYPEALLRGFAMDAAGHRYATVDDLLVYAYRVAATVGLMMCHVMGVSGDAALDRAAHLGIAMQLTNICRDVAEDWAMGRLYLPDALLARHGGDGLRDHLGSPLPGWAREPVVGAVGDLLDLADRYYRSGERGLRALPPRAAFGVRVARFVYAGIGARLRARGGDPIPGRVWVPAWRKLVCVCRAALGAAAELPARLVRRRGYRAPAGVLEVSHVSRL